MKLLTKLLTVNILVFWFFELITKLIIFETTYLLTNNISKTNNNNKR
jgi:hypothetical protein